LIWLKSMWSPFLTTPLLSSASVLGLGPSVASKPGLILVGDETVAALCLSGSVSASHSVEAFPTLDAARARVSSFHNGIIVTELDLPDGDGSDLCGLANAGAQPILVLVITSDATRVPRALRAGCHSVLLKPFPPNLLYARLGRLTRDLQSRCCLPNDAMSLGTNLSYPTMTCPRCGCAGATSFDATSLRRAWFACLTCDHVWIARRQE
jgi:DNA-binding response OmpR family regulator